MDRGVGHFSRESFAQSSPKPNLIAEQEQVVRLHALNKQRSKLLGAKPSDNSVKKGPILSSEDSDAFSLHDRQLHEQYSSDLARMAVQLKQNSLMFGEILKKDEQV